MTVKRWLRMVKDRAPGEPLPTPPLPTRDGLRCLDPVCEAVSYEDLEAVEALLRAGWEVNRHGSTLALAVRMQNPGIVEVLRSHGAQPDTPDPFGSSALIAAVLQGSPQMLRGLLSIGADPDRKDAEGRTALWLAAKRKRIEETEILLQAGANPNLADNEGILPIMKAGNRATFELLYPHCVKHLGQCDYKGRSLWQHLYGRHEILRFLMRNSPDQVPATLQLWEAWRNSDRAKFEALAEKHHQDLTKDQPIVDSRTVLWLAASLNSRKWTEHFCSAGWNPNLPDKHGIPPTSATSSPRVAEILRRHGGLAG